MTKRRKQTKAGWVVTKRETHSPAELDAMTMEELAVVMPRQRFGYALAYDRRGSQVAAYREAYHVAPDAGDWVRQEASKVHRDPRVQAMLRKLAAERLVTHQEIQSRVIDRLRSIISTSLDAVFMYDGKTVEVRPTTELPPEAAAALKRVRVRCRVVGKGERRREVERITVELHDPVAACSTLMRLLGLNRPPEVRPVTRLPRLHELTKEQLDQLLGS